MSIQKHYRNHFFKYSTFETAKKVIASKSFKWSSPIKFNDPFDHQTGFSLDFSREDFAECLTASVMRILYSEVKPIEESNIVKSCSSLISNQLDRDQIYKKIYDCCYETALYLPTHIESFNADIQKIFCNFRVFCVSESYDNVVMWSHYADEHKGVVFKLHCINDVKSVLHNAREVNYLKTFRSFAGADQFAKHLTREQPIDFNHLCLDLAFIKHSDWSYEKEWRMHYISHGELGENDIYVSEDPRIFEAIYLGCRMGQQEITEIMELAKQYLPNTKILLGNKSNSSFSLSFEEIKF